MRLHFAAGGVTFCLRRFEEQLAGALQMQLKRGKPGLALSIPGFLLAALSEGTGRRD